MLQRMAQPSSRSLEVVIPVLNEQGALAQSLRRLHEYLTATFAADEWQITIVDNGSTDSTPQIAQALASDLPSVRLLSLTQRGRGLALRTAWSQSEADVLCYMDVDLSTDLRALPPLIAPLLSGHSDLAIGTRLAGGSRIERGAKRELISRAYNKLLKVTLAARFSDAQCGFKAITRDAAQSLLPAVQDNGWFFDTELLMAAQRTGMRIHEVPVDWIDDKDTRVQIVPTAVGDLRGIARLLASARLTRFLAIGVISTIAYAVLYLLMRPGLGAGGANAAALAITAVANTQANRALTFGIRGRRGLLRQHTMGAGVYVLTLGLTAGALSLLHLADTTPARWLELSVLIAASVCATATRFALLRSWVFAHRTLGFGRRVRALAPPPANPAN